MTKKDWLIVFLSIAVAISITINAFAFQCITFVSGKYGTKCYINGFEHGNIVTKVYHTSLEECKNYIK